MLSHLRFVGQYFSRPSACERHVWSLSGRLVSSAWGGRGRKVPVQISTYENFLNIKVIPTKCDHFYQNLLGNKILKKFCVNDITCCHGNAVFDAMFTKILTF